METNDTNRPDPGAVVETNLDRLAPGDSITVTFELQGKAASVALGAPTQIKTWIKNIDGLYEKSSWESAPETNEGQEFNGGELKLLTEIDVFSPRQWSWTHNSSDAEQWEGWVPGNEQTKLSSDNGLAIGAIDDNADRLIVDSPYLPDFAAPFRTIRFNAEPTTTGRIYWRAENEEFDEARSFVLDGESDNSIPTEQPEVRPFQMRLTVDNPTRITQLALLPAGSTTPDVTIPDAGLGAMPSGGNPGSTPQPEPMGQDGGTSEPNVAMHGNQSIDDKPMTQPSAPEPARVKRVYMEGGCSFGPGKPVSTGTLFLGILLCLRGARTRRRRLGAETQM